MTDIWFSQVIIWMTGFFFGLLFSWYHYSKRERTKYVELRLLVFKALSIAAKTKKRVELLEKE